ncbi:MAG: prepilin-type N-terminal cleavage/methylation domain-containing protein [Bacteriovoracaceae bacterium]
MKKFNKALGHHGFTIVEIMVALMLVAMVFALIPSNTADDERARLDQTLDDFNRAVRFATNESILRNAIVRVSIDLESEPQEYTVEYSTEGGMALPEIQDLEDLSFDEREAQQRAAKDLNSQFQKVAEFSKEAKKIPMGVLVLGVANINRNDIVQSGNAYIYFYPTGEKDNALIFLSTMAELATLDIPPFENTTFSDYSIYSEADHANLGNAQQAKMKELYEQWLKL